MIADLLHTYNAMGVSVLSFCDKYIFVIALCKGFGCFDIQVLDRGQEGNISSDAWVNKAAHASF